MSEMYPVASDRARVRVVDVTCLCEERWGLIGALRVFIARRRANALLRRTLRPFRRGSGAPLPPRLLEDIGLPPDFPI